MLISETNRFAVYPGGICNEPEGRGSSVAIPSQDWQRWRIVWDRTSGDWRSETITWFMNDQQFHRVRGDEINDHAVWESLAAKPLYFILNVAVGGDWVSFTKAVWSIIHFFFFLFLLLPMMVTC